MRETLKSIVWLSFVAGICGCSSMSAIGLETVHWRDESAPSGKAQAIARYLEAVVLAGQGKEAQSIEALSKIPELDPKAVTPTVQLIQVYLKAENYEAALSMCEKAVAQQPDQANLQVVLGEIYHRFKRYDEAMTAFQTAIKLEPDNALGYGALVELQQTRNDLTAAIDIYERLIELTPDQPGVYYALALVLIRIDDKEGAIEALHKTLELDARNMRAQYLLGVLLLETNQNEDCIAQLRSYMDGRPNDMDAADNLAGAQARLGRFEQAIALYQRILNSNQAQPQHNIASMYLHLRAKRYDELPKLSPAQGAPYFDMIFRALAQQESGASPQLLVKALESTEGDLDAECGTYLNNILYLFGQEDAGNWLYDAVGRLAAQEDSRILQLVRARILMNMNRHGEAIPILDTVLAKFPPDQWVHYYLAVCHEELDHFAETESHIAAYMQFVPDDPDILNFLAYLYAEQGVKLDEAVALLNRAMAADPENPYYMDSLGWTYYKQGRANDAVDLIQKAIYGMETDDAVLRDHLGDAYLLKGDVARAREEWQRARRLDPDLTGIQEKLDQHKN
jgi:tetratricopeptide (TPR) repeat protein